MSIQNPSADLASPPNLSSTPVIHSKRAVLRRPAQAFFQVLVIALITCLSPFKALGYVAPILVIGWYVLFSGKQRALANALFWLVGWIVIILLYMLFSPGFAVPSAFLAIITYSSFMVIPVIQSKDIISPLLWQKTLTLLHWVVLAEGTLGLVQAVYGYTLTQTFAGSTGDFVEGTLHPWLLPDPTFSNPMFAMNMVLMLLTLAPSVVLQRKHVLPFLIGGTAFILANVLHVVYLLVIALAIAFVLYYPMFLKYKVGLLLVTVSLLVAIASIRVTGFQGDLIDLFLNSVLSNESPRGVVVNNVFNEMPEEYPMMPLVGIGPGQFSSRAGLIGTGLYFGGVQNPEPVPFLTPAMSPAFRKYVLDAWINFPLPRYLATTSSAKPYFSWLSVYVEFGFFVFMGIAILIAIVLLRLRRYARTPFLRVHLVALGAGILLMFFLGVQENYWEVPQAILVGLLLFKVQLANIRGEWYKYVALQGHS